MNSKPAEKIIQEESLDPSNWEELRQLGHRMVDDMMDYLQTVRERPAWMQPPDQVLKSLQQPLPQLPQEAAAVYEDFITQVRHQTKRIAERARAVDDLRLFRNTQLRAERRGGARSGQ